MNPAYYVNYTFYVGTEKKLQCNYSDWRNVSLELEPGAHEIKWELKLDSKTPIGECPNFANGQAWITNLAIIRATPPEKYKFFIDPPSGCLNDTFTYNISSTDLLDYPASDVILEIKDPRLGTWHNFGEATRDASNITFVVSLSFIEPPFLGLVEFRLKKGNNHTDSHYGPAINFNLRNMHMESNGRTISMDVISDSCMQDICLKYNNHTIIERYTGCGAWRSMSFGPLNSINDNLSFEVNVCDT